MKFRIALVILLLLNVTVMAANITGWRINDRIINGKVYVPSTTTAVSYEVYCSKTVFETDVTLKFGIGTINSNNQITILSGPITVTASDFDDYSPGSDLLIKNVTFNINSSQVYNNRLYFFEYVGNLGPIQSFQSYETTDQLPSQGSNELFTGTPIPFPAHFKSTYYQYNVDLK